MLSKELGVERLNLENEKDVSAKLDIEISELNANISNLNKKLSELEQALSVSLEDIESKKLAITDLKSKLNIALKEKIGELSEYRSEFFGKLKEILKDQKRNQHSRR